MPITRDEAHEVTRAFLRDYPGARDLGYKFRQDVAELYESRAAEVPAHMKGGYLPREELHNGRILFGRVDVPLQNIDSPADLMLTLRHEVLGHYGTNTFTPSEKRALLDGLAASSNEPSVKDLWDKVNRAYAGEPMDRRSEEVFALYCERIEPSRHLAADQVQQRGERSFAETCIARSRPMQADDLDNIACMVAQGLRDRSRTQQNFPQLNQFFRKDESMEPKKPFHEIVAEKLIEQLKAGTAPWQKPWKPGQPGAYLPMNPTTGKRYKGINAIHLMAQGRGDARWMTYKQASAAGAQVRKGEKGTPVQYWKFSEEQIMLDDKGRPVRDAKGEPVKENVLLERPRVFFATVFNGEQIDGLPPLQPKQEQTWNAVERAEHILSASGAKITHAAGDRAFYRPSSDSITMPERGQFPSADSYYATALHELGHWTGHASRLDRDLSNPFGSEAYAKEELRAEIASMILGDELGIGHDPGQHAAYVGSWIKALQNEPMEIFRAAADAEKIHGFVMAFEQQQVQTQQPAQQVAQQEEAQTQEHYSDATLKALVEKHGWEVAYTGLREPGRVDSVQRTFEGVGPLGTMVTPNGERRLSVGYQDDAERRRYVALRLGGTVIADADGRDRKPEEVAQQLNARAEQYADERRVRNGLEPLYSVDAQQADAQPLDDELREHGQAITSHMDAQARWADGERIYAFHEQADEPHQVGSLDELNNYAPDQLMALPALTQEQNQEATMRTAEAQNDSILRALEAAGWTRGDGVAIASKSFETVNVQNDAQAFLTNGDGFNRTLQFQYLSEGRNVVEADAALIPVDATAERAAEIATSAAARAQKSIEGSYGVRVAAMLNSQQQAAALLAAHPADVVQGIEQAAAARRQLAGGAIDGEAFTALSRQHLGVELPPDWSGELRTVGVAERDGQTVDAGQAGIEPQAFQVYARKADAAFGDDAFAFVAGTRTQAEADTLTDRLQLVDALSADDQHERAARLARVKEERVQRDPNATEEELSAAKENRKTAEAAMLVAAEEKRSLIDMESMPGHKMAYSDQPGMQGAEIVTPDGELISFGGRPALERFAQENNLSRKDLDTLRTLDAKADQYRTEPQYASEQPTQQRAEKPERQYLNVPYKEKDEAKGLGARWDRQQQSWYVPPGVDAAPLAKWAQSTTTAAEAPRTAQPAPTAQEGAQQAPQQARQYLAVPYEQRNAAKAAGALWDKAAKSWYAGPRADAAKLARWKPENVQAEQGPAMTPREEFAEAMRGAGLFTGSNAQGDHPIMDGKRHRVPVEGGKKGALDGFYVGHLDGHPAGRIINNKTGIDFNWKSKGYALSDQDRAKLQAEAADKMAQRAVEQDKAQEATAQRVRAQMADLVPVEQPTPYLQSKGVQAHAGVMTDREGTKTYIPAFDADGKQWTMQYIQEDGTKRFAKDSKKEGCFHPVGGMDALAAAPALVISEGYATAAQVAETVGHATVAAFDSGNLEAVARALHAKFPDKPVIVAGDDDRHLVMTLGHNPGRVKAEAAAQAVGGKAVFPIFAPAESNYPRDVPAITPDTYKGHLRAEQRLADAAAGSVELADGEASKLKASMLSGEQIAALSKMKQYTDFNDLAHKSELGIDGVKRQISAAVSQVQQREERPQQVQKQIEKQPQQIEQRPRRAARIG